MLPQTHLQTTSDDGHAQAFAALYDAHLPRIYKYVFYRVHHKETAEDLTSVVFTKAFEEFSSFSKEKGTFSAWLYGIAHNAVIDHYRKLKPTAQYEDVWDALRDGSDLPRDLDVSRQLEEIQSALTVLSPLQRELVLLRVWDGYSYAEIAEITGKSEAACKMGVSRALTALRSAVPLLIFLSFFIPPAYDILAH